MQFIASLQSPLGGYLKGYLIIHRNVYEKFIPILRWTGPSKLRSAARNLNKLLRKYHKIA